MPTDTTNTTTTPPPVNYALDEILKGIETEIKINEYSSPFKKYVVEGFNFNGLDLSNQNLENLHFKNCSFLSSKMPNLKKVVFYEGSNLFGADFSSKTLEDVFFGYPYLDGMMIKNDPNLTLVGANFYGATFTFSQDSKLVSTIHRLSGALA